jgi:ferredoxin
MRLEIDASRCEGTGFCAQLAPDVFRLDADPPVRLMSSAELSDGQVEICCEAAELCPTRAIRLLE